MFITKHPLYLVYHAMINRCTLPSVHNYHRYGGRGITVCQRWLDHFENFLADMGERPSPTHQLDRKVGTLGYSPENCHWVTPSQNSSNRGLRRLTNTSPMRFIQKHGRKWRVLISIFDRQYRTAFDTLEDAINFRSDYEFEREMHLRLGL